MLSIKPKNINQESLELGKNMRRNCGPIEWNSRISFDFSQARFCHCWGKTESLNTWDEK